MPIRQDLGRWGENLAAGYLTEKGFVIRERNVRTPYGELDLVAQEEEVLVFIEVKTRASVTLGPPEISVSSAKQTHLLSAAQAYLQAHPEITGDWRIDLIAILRLPGQEAQIEHFENIITAES